LKSIVENQAAEIRELRTQVAEIRALKERTSMLENKNSEAGFR